MKSLVIYDSLYGNTKKIAEAIADGLSGEIDLVHVNEVDSAEVGVYDLIVVGAPTHGGMASEPMRKLLGKVQKSALKGIRVAAFDTRHPAKALRIIGFAAKKIGRALEKKGGHLIGEPEGFFVADTEGPLLENELERATAWAEELAELVKE
jgi:flavodoxin